MHYDWLKLFTSNVASNQYALFEIMHYDWLKLVIGIVASNQYALFESRVGVLH